MLSYGDDFRLQEQNAHITRQYRQLNYQRLPKLILLHLRLYHRSLLAVVTPAYSRRLRGFVPFIRPSRRSKANLPAFRSLQSMTPDRFWSSLRPATWIARKFAPSYGSLHALRSPPTHPGHHPSRGDIPAVPFTRRDQLGFYVGTTDHGRGCW